ncbi:MAG: hypothetical protein O2788_03215 [Chloroflexi bacterium]|nr:hypothetical protein [Chloroflexota bacterium]
MKKKLVIGIFGAFIFLNVLIVLIAFISTRDRDLEIPNTAVDFQKAIYGGNFEALWTLSAPEYRAGMRRDIFLEWARANAPQPDVITNWTVRSEPDGDIALVHTLVELGRGGTAEHTLTLVRVDGEWKISKYETPAVQ